jgi:mannose-6-phosphate isomerase-like protein (cupin superfamily)
MALKVARGEGTQMGLPGRSALEVVSGALGARSMTFRQVEIPVARPGDAVRAPHVHDAFEECIHIVSGQGVTCTESGDFPVGPGDTMIIPPGELHVTRNVGDEPLVLFCFFPVADIAPGTSTGAFPEADT